MAIVTQAPKVPVRASRAQHGILLAAATLAIITYIDRVCISQAAPAIQRDLGLTTVQMGWAFAAFAWAYALFEIPGGWLGDKIGPRRVLIRIVLWWSFFTAATGWARNLASLLVTRFFFGAGEAGCFPNFRTPDIPLRKLVRFLIIWKNRPQRIACEDWCRERKSLFC